MAIETLIFSSSEDRVDYSLSGVFGNHPHIFQILERAAGISVSVEGSRSRRLSVGTGRRNPAKGGRNRAKGVSVYTDAVSRCCLRLVAIIMGLKSYELPGDLEIFSKLVVTRNSKLNFCRSFHEPHSALSANQGLSSRQYISTESINRSAVMYLVFYHMPFPVESECLGGIGLRGGPLAPKAKTF